MKCVIISKEKVIDLGKRCLSNLRDFVNNEYCLGFNEVKRLRTLFFLACQKVVGEKQKLKVWNEKLEEKFWEVVNYVKKSKEGDESEVEEIFNKQVLEKYSRVEFSLKETARIFDLVEDGLYKCNELDEDFYYEIKDFKKIYDVYNYCYKSLDRNYIIN